MLVNELFALQNKFMNNVTRRTWDLSQYASSAAEARAEAEAREKEIEKAKKGLPSRAVVVRNPLKRREGESDIYANVGKFQVITTSTPLSQRGGFYCHICDCLLKDSASWLDHLNGRKRAYNVRLLGWCSAAVLQINVRLA